MQTLKKYQELILGIDDAHHEGCGIAHYEGQVIFVSQALPSERVRLRITKVRSTHAEAEVIEWLEKSPERIVPECQAFERCGGCLWQHASKSLQQKIKIQHLKQLFHAHHLPLEVDCEPAFLSPYGYRRRARLSVRYDRKKDRVLVGFREKHSHFVTETAHCPVLKNPDWPKRLSDLLVTLDARMLIPQLEYYASKEGEAFGIRTLSALAPSDVHKLMAFMEQWNIRLWIQPHAQMRVIALDPTEDITMLCGRIRALHETGWGGDAIQLTYPIADLEMAAGPFDFVQINQEVSDWMFHQALAWLNPQPTERLLDLFCGLGPFALHFAPHVLEAHGMELDPAMVQRAQAAAPAHLRFEVANLFMPPHDNLGHYDLVIIDPPRSGMEHCAAWIHKIQPRAVLYVSCHPATMVRDLAPLILDGSYRIQKIAAMDMFAQTKHMEAMVLLERR